jgi:hypothetical protein
MKCLSIWLIFFRREIYKKIILTSMLLTKVTFASTKANITKTEQVSIVEQNNRIYLYTQYPY